MNNSRIGFKMTKEKDDHKETENHQRNFMKHLIMNKVKQIKPKTLSKKKTNKKKNKHKTQVTRKFPKNKKKGQKKKNVFN